jgi:D-hexose-6-phosphate mutarotase
VERRFSEGVSLEPGPGGLERLWPVLWLSGASRFEHDCPIRGGVPVCFPWFGPKATTTVRVEPWTSAW